MAEEEKKTYDNVTLKLKSHPVGDPTSENFDLVKSSISAADVADGGILVEVKIISVDAYLRGIMNAGAGGAHENVGLGNAMHSVALGKIVVSKNDKFPVGGYVYAKLEIAMYDVLPKASLDAGMVQLCQIKSDDLEQLQVYLTYMGIAVGCSAYVGVYYVSKDIKKDDIAVVNGASGGVGSFVCQMYRNRGAKVIAITGGAEKKEYLMKEYGLYQVINYKEEDVNAKLKEYAPNGFDIAWDNVGGKQLELLLNNLAQDAQIVLCGAVSQYSKAKADITGPRNYINMIGKNASMTGFIMFKYYKKLREINTDIMKMVQEKKLAPIKVTKLQGLDKFADAMAKLLTGDKMGKVLLYT